MAEETPNKPEEQKQEDTSKQPEVTPQNVSNPSSDVSRGNDANAIAAMEKELAAQKEKNLELQAQLDQQAKEGADTPEKRDEQLRKDVEEIKWDAKLDHFARLKGLSDSEKSEVSKIAKEGNLSIEDAHYKFAGMRALDEPIPDTSGNPIKEGDLQDKVLSPNDMPLNELEGVAKERIEGEFNRIRGDQPVAQSQKRPIS